MKYCKKCIYKLTFSLSLSLSVIFLNWSLLNTGARLTTCANLDAQTRYALFVQRVNCQVWLFFSVNAFAIKSEVFYCHSQHNCSFVLMSNFICNVLMPNSALIVSPLFIRINFTKTCTIFSLFREWSVKFNCSLVLIHLQLNGECSNVIRNPIFLLF